MYLREGFQPSYYTCVDVDMLRIPELLAEVEEYGSKSNIVYVNQEIDHEWPDHFLPIRCLTPYDDDGNYVAEFSMKPLNVVVDGGTVTYVQMQLAYYMGYRRLYLVGLDHTSGDKEYFDPEYASPLPPKTFTEKEYQELTELYYEKANEVFEGQIFNLTPGSQLKVFTDRSDRLQWPKLSRRS